MTKRPIAAIPLPDVELLPAPTALPETTWIDPRELLVDEAYQRNLSERSIALIRRIAAGWDWRRFKTPNCAWTDEGLEVIDGQHTAIGAACRPDILTIPVLVTDAAGQQDRAAAFIGLNRDRVAITATQLHAAAITAGDAEALAIEEACAAAGITVLKSQPGAGRFKPRQTMAVAAIGALVRRYGRDAQRTLGILAEAEAAPIQANHIKAVEHLLTAAEFAELDPDGLTRAIRSLGDEAEKEAKLFAATHCVPLWRGLAAVWFKKAPRRRKGASSGSASMEPLEQGLPPARPNAARLPAPAYLEDMKRDDRPAKGGWSPGRHIRRCSACDSRFQGATSATRCAECAYGETAHA